MAEDKSLVLFSFERGMDFLLRVITEEPFHRGEREAALKSKLENKWRGHSFIAEKALTHSYLKTQAGGSLSLDLDKIFSAPSFMENELYSSR